ncbi:MAG: PD-(D/E)XK nuclease family protein [Verrucomicrobiota bacterium]
MQTRFLLGAAGSGKTFRCLEEIRGALQASPEGAPLILIAPKQATFLLERQLLADASLRGYTRLQILSFDRLADFVLNQLQRAPAKLLTEEGRVMVLRALLAQQKDRLKIFHASARMPGFAQELSLLLRELQHHQIAPEALRKLSDKAEINPHLAAKIHDLALLLESYFAWIKTHELRDAHVLLDLAADALREESKSALPFERVIRVDGLWLDGFAEMTPQELNLLAAFVPCCQSATLAFCLDAATLDRPLSGLSIWAVVRKTYRDCLSRLQQIPACQISTETLPHDPAKTRFASSPPLRHLEKNWSAPKPFIPPADEIFPLEKSVRLAKCFNPEAEAILAAREILRFVQNGGRFRQVAILLRQFEGYHDVLRRTLARCDIPVFLDRRESATHHPLAELTRSAMRLAAFDWQHDDFFGALKTGMIDGGDFGIDQFENESLARGWNKNVWLQPLPAQTEESLERLRRKFVSPFQQFCETLHANRKNVTGSFLAATIQKLWRDIRAGETLELWSEENALHLTLWEQMQSWLQNIALAFAGDALEIKQWIPILDAGLSGMSVGVVPPALDQVLVGTVDRSRNPDLKLVLIPGLNESVFPATPAAAKLLTEADHAELARQEITLAPNRLEWIGRERFYGYIACTRSSERLVLSCSTQDARGRVLNPSSIFSSVAELFPTLPVEEFSTAQNWPESWHASELLAPLLRCKSGGELEKMAAWPGFDSLREPLGHFASLSEAENLSPARAQELYGPVLKTSVSALEQFAACPFRFFVSAGLGAQERKIFQIDVRERGSFQHEVLAKFHTDLRAKNKLWRDLSVDEARENIGKIGAELQKYFREGMFSRDAQSDFAARTLTGALQDFIATTVDWMRQYEFDPHAVELSFGTAERTLPAWEIDLEEGHKLAFRGRIDRVDIFRRPGGNEALAVVMDYKSSAKQFDPVLLENGLQLQLPAYLALLRQLPDPREVFGVEKLVPAGVFFVNLRGRFPGGKTRSEVLDGLEKARYEAYQHSGRFDFSALAQLDNRGEKNGTQFNYQLKNDHQPKTSSRELMRPENFRGLLDAVEKHLVRMGREIFAGVARVDPYQKGKIKACDQCDYAGICRIDFWQHQFRMVK